MALLGLAAEALCSCGRDCGEAWTTETDCKKIYMFSLKLADDLVKNA
jgi:hypothetical protein